MMRNLIFHKDLCYDCHDEWQKEHHLCQKCLDKLEFVHGRNRILDTVDCAFPYYYGGSLQNLLIRFKFRKESYLYPIFSNLLYDYSKDYKYRWDEIISVPYTRKKAQKRGFEPVSLMARDLAKKLELPLNPALEKIRETTDQHLLSDKERMTNLKDAFKIKKPMEGKRILLIDDIMTTGATLRACSQVLLDHGACKVDCLVVASEKRQDKGFWV